MNAIENSLHDALTPKDGRIHVFSHLSQIYPSGSSIYTTFIFRLGETPGQTLDTWKRLKQSASNTIVTYGGTISHQHGVGKDHKTYMAAEKGKLGIQTLEQLLDHLDPEQLMNPGKLVPDLTEDREQMTEE
jgi:alkyldihydroxyacetonephosphate synthase